MVKWARYFEVSTSGYTTWFLERLRRQEQKEKYDQMVKEIFEIGKKTYGADRIVGILRKKGNQASYKKVKCSLNEQKLYLVHLKYQRSQPSSRRARGDGYPNLLKNTEITKPLQALSSDISYIPTNEGFEEGVEKQVQN